MHKRVPLENSGVPAAPAFLYVAGGAAKTPVEWMTTVAEKLPERVASHTRLVPLLKGRSCIPLDRQPSPPAQFSKLLNTRAPRCLLPAAARRSGWRSYRRSWRREPILAQSVIRASAELAGMFHTQSLLRRKATATYTVSLKENYSYVERNYFQVKCTFQTKILLHKPFEPFNQPR